MEKQLDISGHVLAIVDAKAEALKDEIINAPDIPQIGKRTFYMSANGSDNNDGTTPETAWRSISRLNEAELVRGDMVLFERGGVWRGELISKAGVTYAAYGAGEKPKLYGSPENGAGADKWELVNAEKNIWKYCHDLPDVGLIVFNHGEKHSTKALPDYVNGRYVLRDDSRAAFDIHKHLDSDLMLFSACDRLKYTSGLPAVGRKDSTGPLYLRCDAGNPGALFDSIEFCTRPNIISLCCNSDIAIDNLCLKYCGGLAIGGTYCMNIRVTNCEIGWIGGAIQKYYDDGKAVRYGNGIEVAGSCCNLILEHNWVYQNYDAGLSYQAGNKQVIQTIVFDVKFTNNLIEFCSYGIEYFLGDAADPRLRNYQKDVAFSDNIIRYSGFGFGEQRPDKATSAAIKTWPSSTNDAENFIIKYNIFDRSRYCLIYLAAHKHEWLPTYRDNLILQTVGTEARLGEYIVKDQRVSLTTEELDSTEKLSYFKLLGASIYLTEKDWLYDLAKE